VGVLGAHRPALHGQRAPHPRVNTAAPLEVDQSPGRDRPQPGRRRRAVALEAALGHQRRRERLPCEIAGHLGVAGATSEVAQQRPDVAVVEQLERLGILGAEQILSGRQVV
jgi:hypothetical protein